MAQKYTDQPRTQAVQGYNLVYTRTQSQLRLLIVWMCLPEAGGGGRRHLMISNDRHGG